MNDKVIKIEKEYADLQNELGKLDIQKDQKKYIELSRRLAELEPVANKIAQIKKVKETLLKNQEHLGDSDEEIRKIAQDEVLRLKKEVDNLGRNLEEELATKDPRDTKNVIMEIRAGAGGDEAALFAASLYRMYLRLAERKGFKASLMSTSRTGIGGYKEVIFEIKGNNVFGTLKYESGVHRVQRIPETEKSGRIHTSTVTVAVLPEADPIDFEIRSEDLRIDTFRAGGHGGQNVNKVETAVRITHLPTNTMAICQDEKSQSRNKEKALVILRSRLLAVEEEKRRKESGDERKSQIGTGDRSEKIRTYNFPQDRVTDHRIKQTVHGIDQILDGNIDELISLLQKAAKDKS